MSLVDYGKFNPTIDPGVFPSTPVASSASNAWQLTFSFGFTSYNVTTQAAPVRCVR